MHRNGNTNPEPYRPYPEPPGPDYDTRGQEEGADDRWAKGDPLLDDDASPEYRGENPFEGARELAPQGEDLRAETIGGGSGPEAFALDMQAAVMDLLAGVASPETDDGNERYALLAYHVAYSMAAHAPSAVWEQAASDLQNLLSQFQYTNVAPLWARGREPGPTNV
jgi:hypothetical protein